MANNYEVNYDDERFGQVESDKQQALTELEQTYGGMIEESDSYYDAQIEASKQWADTQSQLQQEQTDFAIEQIGQQKDQAHKDYVKEQSGAYVDWQKQSNQYGAEAERQAAAGMNGTGFSESSQVSMFNTYQNRVATARDAFSRAVLNYDNAIKDARLQNNAALAEIAYQSLQQQLELSLQGFQYKNNLILDKANKKTELDNIYWGRYQDVLNQINTENAMKLEVEKFNESVRQFEENYKLEKAKFEEQIRQFDAEIARLKAKDEQEHRLEIEKLEFQKEQAEEEKRRWEEEMQLEREKLEEEKRQFDLQYKNSTSGGGGGGSSSNSNNNNNSGTVTKNGSTGNNNRENIADTPSNPTSNMASILALGYGPISEAKLASLIASGQVTRTLKNGQYYYSNVQPSSTNRLKNMGLSY